MGEKELARRKMKRNFGLRYLGTLLLYVGVIVLSFFLIRAVCSTRIWYADDPDYLLLRELKDHAAVIAFVMIGIGWSVITWQYIRKWMGYLDVITQAAEQIPVSPDQAVVLPGELKPIQDELNAVRESTVRTAYLAKEAEQRKNDLLVYLAHDLKTPLTSVIGYLSLLQEEKEISPKLREKYTGIACRKAERLEGLINEFFEITRFNLTHIELELENIHLSRMMEQICSEFEPVLREKGLQWKLGIQPGIEMTGDPDKLSRVFDNLIRNAVNYSYPDSVICAELSTEDDKIVFRIRNHGKTISKEKLARIFDQFFRVDSSRGTQTGGAGLGLAIAKEIVELHGGSIRAESEKESILFEIIFPLKMS